MKLNILILSVCIGYVFTADIPDKFVGKWSVGKSENFDEYLSEKGYSWFTRQLVKAASITKTFQKAGPGRITVEIDTTTKDVKWENVPFGEEFTGEYVDSAQHRVSVLIFLQKSEVLTRKIVVFR